MDKDIRDSEEKNLKGIISGEEIEEVSNTIRRDFDYLLGEHNTVVLEDLLKHDADYSDIQKAEESFIKSLQEAFSKLEDMKEKILTYMQNVDEETVLEEILFLDMDQRTVLHGCIIVEYHRKMVEIQKEQEKKGSEVIDMYFPGPEEDLEDVVLEYYLFLSLYRRGNY